MIILTSNGKSKDLKNVLIEKTKKEMSELKISLIENASDIYKEGKNIFREEYEEYIIKHREIIKEQGFQFTIEDLKINRSLENFIEYDIIWLSSGNLYYLNWLLKRTKFSEILKDFLKEDKILICTGAASIVICENIKYYDYLYNEILPVKNDYKGLSFTKKNIIPFWNGKYQVILKEIKNHYKELNKDIVEISDNEHYILKINDEV